MAINNFEAIYNQYIQMTSTTGNVLNNKDGIDSILYSNGELLFSETDGDKITVAAGELSDEILSALEEKLGLKITKEADIEETNASKTADTQDGTKTGETKNTDKTTEANKTSETKKSEDEAALEANKAKLAEYQAKWNYLQGTSESIEKVVEALSTSIKTSITQILAEQNKITDEEEERIQKVIDDELAQYKADVKAGKNVSIETLNKNIQAGMKNSGFDSKMQALVGALFVTNAQINEMESLLGELGTISAELENLDPDIAALESEISKQEEAAAAKAAHDPIGFESDGIKYEFVVDKDNNNQLTDISEFLGSEKNFEEMTALDADKSGDVTKEELSKGNVKVLVTDKEGNQTLKSLDEAFGEDSLSINVNDYKENTDENKKASNGQKLLGNFNLTLGNKTLEGYNTLDTDEYLLANYKFSSDKPEGETSTEAKENERTGVSDSIQNFIKEYEEKLEQYKKDYDTALEGLGFDGEFIKTLKELGEATGKAEATAYINELEETNKTEETEESKDADKDAETDETKDADEAKTSENIDDEDKKDKEEK